MKVSEVITQMLYSVEMPKFNGRRESFTAWLKFLHGLMLASEPLLELAIERSEGALRDYYRDHLAEEHDHAQWIAEDIATLGENVLRVDHAAAATAGAQYYYLRHVGPQLLLGYIAALEFRPVPLAHVDQLASLYGEKALRTIRYHAAHDPGHAKTLASVIDRHEAFAREITYNAIITARMYAHYLKERIPA